MEIFHENQPWTFILVKHKLKQTDGASCGVFTLKFAQCWAKGCRPEFVSAHIDNPLWQADSIASDIVSECMYSLMLSLLENLLPGRSLWVNLRTHSLMLLS